MQLNWEVYENVFLDKILKTFSLSGCRYLDSYVFSAMKLKNKSLETGLNLDFF